MKIVMLFAVLILAALAGFAVGYRAGHGGSQRTEDVRMWAEALYEDGRYSCRVDISDEVKEHNKQFSIDAVILAHEGAWH